METFSALLAICAGNSPVPGEFPAQRPVTRSFDVFFYLRLNKRLSKQSRGWWFETLSRPFWRHCDEQDGWHQVIYHLRNTQCGMTMVSFTKRIMYIDEITRWIGAYCKHYFDNQELKMAGDSKMYITLDQNDEFPWSNISIVAIVLSESGLIMTVQAVTTRTDGTRRAIHAWVCL